jgi:hypothetical protein
MAFSPNCSQIVAAGQSPKKTDRRLRPLVVLRTAAATIGAFRSREQARPEENWVTPIERICAGAYPR